MTSPVLVLATRNPGKIAELRGLLGAQVLGAIASIPAYAHLERGVTA